MRPRTHWPGGGGGNNPNSKHWFTRGHPSCRKPRPGACQQPSKKPRPSSKRGNTASDCNSIHATTDPTPVISVLRPLRTGHNRLNHYHPHLIAKFRSELRPCQTGSSMATEHLLPACPLHDNLRNRSWPLATPEAARQPERPAVHTTAFAQRAWVFIWVIDKKQKKLVIQTALILHLFCRFTVKVSWAIFLRFKHRLFYHFAPVRHTWSSYLLPIWCLLNIVWGRNRLSNFKTKNIKNKQQQPPTMST